MFIRLHRDQVHQSMHVGMKSHGLTSLSAACTDEQARTRREPFLTESKTHETRKHYMHQYPNTLEISEAHTT